MIWKYYGLGGSFFLDLQDILGNVFLGEEEKQYDGKQKRRSQKDKKGKKRFKAVAVSHEWKRRKQKNPLELKKGVNPENRKEKAFVIHEIVDDDANKFQKSRKYTNYSVHLTDRRRLKRTIDKWEREPEDFREPFPKDKRTREIIRRQKEEAKQKAVIKKQEKR